jgi:DNA uptake protein ComE-like DNA-binding protein
LTRDSLRNLPRRPAASVQRRGTILIVTMIVSFALAGSVIVLCRSMRVEMQASANMAASLEASSIERGAEQYVLALIGNYKDELRGMSEDEFAAVPVGTGYFWLLRPDYDDTTLPVFGLVEEAGKLNINDATFEELARLPGMTYEAASSIMDWRDEDSNIERDGAENEYYLGLPEPYYCKNDGFETVEELLLVREFYRPMLYGDGTAPPLGQQRSNRGTDRNLFTDPALARGIYDLVTIYSDEVNQTSDGQARIRLDRLDRSSTLTQFQTKLRELLGTERGNQVAQAATAGRTGTQRRMTSVFQLYFRGKMKPEELDLVVDHFTHDGDNDLERRINPNVAPEAVLRCMDGLDPEDVDKLMAQRTANDPTSNSIAWVAEALGEQKAVAVGPRLTWKSDQYSADILAVSGNGRSFKRVRIVVDTEDGYPQIVYRRDITDRGWPMDPEVLASIRRGEAMNSGARNVLGGGTGSRS